MDPLPESIYFPSLEKCVNGEEILLSWKSLFSVITQIAEPGKGHEDVIKSFLSGPEVVNLLSKPFEAFPRPSPESKAAFHTKSSAINATASPDAQYNIEEIKEDALWLSKEGKIDELSALRIVVVECQSRSATQLLAPFSDEELTNIREAAESGKYTNPLPISQLLCGLDADAFQKEFNDSKSRKQRILHVYLSEKRHFLKCSQTCFEIVLANAYREENESISPGWLAEILSQVTRYFIRRDTTENFLLMGIKSIGENAKNLDSGSGWILGSAVQEDLEIDWSRSQITEAIHSMELVWLHVNYIVHYPSSQVALQWCNLLQSCNFFDRFDAEDQAMQTLCNALQSISVIISLSIFNDFNSLELLREIQTQSDAGPDPSAVERQKENEKGNSFVSNSKAVKEIHASMLLAADFGIPIVGPMILAWSVFLNAMQHRVAKDQQSGGFQDDYPTQFEDLMNELQGAMDDDVIDFLARQAVNQCRVFETLSSISTGLGHTPNSFLSSRSGSMMRICVLELIKDVVGIGYIPEIVEATLSALTAGQTYWDVVDSGTLLRSEDPAFTFLGAENLVRDLLEKAQARYPFESLPFLQMVRAIAASPLLYGAYGGSELPRGDVFLLNFLRETPVFTYTLPVDFVDYETFYEEENNNNIRLTRAVQLFEPRSKLGRGAQNVSLALVRVDQTFVIPAGTSGRIISDSGPRIGLWFHKYSALQYFGKLLETFLTASDQIDATTGMPADRDSVSEIIGLFAAMLNGFARASTRTGEWHQEALEVLNQARAGLSRNRDIVTVIFEIFEEELYHQPTSGSDASLDILVACIQFIHAVLPVAPGRVWPLIARSGLLGVNTGTGRLSGIVEGVELLVGQFPFLTSCCRLFDALIDDLSTNALRRKVGSKSTARFDGISQIGVCVPDQSLSKVILCFTRYLIDVLETSSTWKFVSPDERRCLTKTIGTALDKILRYYYGTDSSIDVVAGDDTVPDRKLVLTLEPKKEESKEPRPLMGVLLPAATHIVESFLATASGTLRFQSLLRSYFDGLETPGCTVYLKQSSMWEETVNSILRFSNTLLRVNILLERPSSQLEKQIFKASPIVARLYAANDSYRPTVLSLLGSLIEAAANETSEPPSLLGHLGPQTTQRFLRLLSEVDKPFSRDSNITKIWHFLAMIVSCRQQWFANYLLTGKTPRTLLEKKGTGGDSAKPSTSFLAIALKTLSNIEHLSQLEALATLEFVALAQNFWPWTVCDSSEYPGFVNAILEFVGTFAPPQLRNGSPDDHIETCFQLRTAAYVAEILAMHLFHSRQTGKPVALDKFLPNLTFFERFAASVPYYNGNLHTLLKRNFETRYSDCTVRDLKHTTLEVHQFGKDYYYDLSLASKMLSLDQAWYGKNNDGMKAEFERANVNLSIVDAHNALFHSWKFLAIELSNKSSHEPELQKLFAKIATDCLQAGEEPQPPEEIFSRLSQARADLALVLTQRLVLVKAPVDGVKGLLATVWNTIRTLRGSFERAVPDGDIVYYRSLLKLLFLTVRVHAEAKSEAAANVNLRMSRRARQQATVVPIILDILKHVVSIGLREIATVIHESPADSSPEDLALITGIMQSCLRVPGVESCHSQVVTTMANNATARVALTLFSWSDNISIEGDPIYGELSMLFLLELSRIPLMAEQLALNGILNDISSANITSFLRGKGVGPFANGAGFQRCYSIWVRGILPLLLNILDAVQQSIACEIALFLNQFSNLLSQCEAALDAPLSNRLPDTGPKKYITLTICSEVNSMALLTYILTGFREVLKGSEDIPKVQWDGGAVLENVEFWLNSSPMLKERILPMGERETEMARKNLLEGRIMVELMGIRDVLTGGDNV